uniref:Putative cation exchanger C521.04c n=1 Tax=Gouania willdenowi TaxID=441366 RepID=A0A8C5HFH5_GOUWI
MWYARPFDNQRVSCLVWYLCSEIHADSEKHQQRHTHAERLCSGPCVGSPHPELGPVETPSTEISAHHYSHYSPKCFLTVHKGTRYGEEGWHEGTSKTTIRADNEVEAHREANNYKFGFRKWKGNVTEKPIEDRSDIDKELYSDLVYVKPHEGSMVSVGNIVYVFVFGWWISMVYLLLSPVLFLTILGAPYGAVILGLLCFQIVFLFISLADVVFQADDELVTCDWLVSGVSSQFRVSTYIWLLLGYPVVAVVHFLACVLSWLLVFTIPVAKMNARTLTTVLLMAPEDIEIKKQENTPGCETRVTLCCYRAFNVYYYKYTVQGINIFALNLLPLVVITLIIGYTDHDHVYFSAETKFATAITSIIPLSYYIGMGIASISAQSNFAVGAVVNATFGSITEMTFYITALLRGHHAATKCYEELVKAALTGTLLGCILFIPGVCMIIGGIKHREQRFNSRSAGVSSALLFISVGGVFAPTLFSKTFGNLMCESCTNIPGNGSVPFICKDCHYDMSQTDPHLILTHIEPLVYTISVLLPAAYLIGLIFTLKTHAHIYDIHISDGHGGHHVVHWSRWRALAVLIVATVLMACCADLSTENIMPILAHSSISQYFIGVTVLAMVPEIPEMANGIQFALQNNISLSFEVGSCIAVQVCMIQIPLLILFNAFYDVGFVLVFSDIHLWASIFSVILVNYIFMDGKCDYFQGKTFI